MARMKRLQISLEPELDAQLGRVARREGVSKAEVVRRSLKSEFRPPPRIADDPIYEFFSGALDGEGRRPGETIDDILYGPAAPDAQDAGGDPDD